MLREKWEYALKHAKILELLSSQPPETTPKCVILEKLCRDRCFYSLEERV